MQYIRVQTADGVKEWPQVNNLPSVIEPPEGFDGVDLTHWPGIALGFGRHGDQRAKYIAQQNPNKVVVYTYGWRGGEGSGVFFPVEFDKKYVVFYKTTNKLYKEWFDAARIAFDLFLVYVRAMLPGFNIRYATTDHTSGKFAITPKQEVFEVDWSVYAMSVEEAKQVIEEKLPFWQDWNRKGIEAYKKYGYENPGFGNIQLVIRYNKAWIFLDYNNRLGVIYHKVGDEWVEEEGVQQAPWN